MALFKCLAFFNCRTRGWSETYVYDNSTQQSPNDSLNFTQLQFANLMQKRVKLAGKQVELYATRISRLTPTRGSQIYYNDLPQPPGFGSNNGGYDTDNPPSTLVVTLANSGFTKKKQTHVRGIPDTIDQQGGRLVTSDTVGFDAAWTDYATALIGPGWGWLGSTVSHTADVESYAQVVGTGQVSFSFHSALFPATDVGKTVSIRVSGINGKSELNGQLTVKIDAVDGATTTSRISVFPYSFGGKARYNELGFVKIVAGSMTKIGSRDTGAPLLQPVGRRSNRVRS